MLSEDPNKWPDDLIVWTAKNIGRPINRTEFQARYLIAKGVLPVRSHNGIFSARVGDLRRACSGNSEKNAA